MNTVCIPRWRQEECVNDFMSFGIKSDCNLKMPVKRRL